MTDKDDAVVKLTGSLSLREATALAEELKAAIGGNTTTIIDSAGLEDADVSIVQVLAAARRSAVAGNRTLALRTVAGDALSGLLTRLGVLDAAGASLVGDNDFWTGAEAKA